MVFAALFLPAGNNDVKKISLPAVFKQMGSLFFTGPLVMCFGIVVTLLFSFVGMYTVLGNDLSEKFGLDSQHVLYIRAAGIVGMVLAPFAGRLVTRFGEKPVLRGGMALAVLGLAVLGISSSLWLLIVMSVVFVAGIAIMVPVTISLVGQLGGKKTRRCHLSLFILFVYGGDPGSHFHDRAFKGGKLPCNFRIIGIMPWCRIGDFIFHQGIPKNCLGASSTKMLREEKHSTVQAQSQKQFVTIQVSVK